MRTWHVDVEALHGAAEADRDCIRNWLHDLGVNTGQASGFNILDTGVQPRSVVVFFPSADACLVPQVLEFVCAPPAPMAAIRRVGSLIDGGGDELLADELDRGRCRAGVGAWSDS